MKKILKEVSLIVIGLFLMSESVNASTIDNILSSKVQNGELIIDSILPQTENEANDYINYKLFSNNQFFNDVKKSITTYGVSCKDNCSNNYSGIYTLRICYGTNCEERDINISFNNAKFDTNVADKINEYLKNMPVGKKYNVWYDNPYEHVIYFDDVELINYIKNLNIKYDPIQDLQNSTNILNQSLEYKRITDSVNIGTPWGFAGNGFNIFLANSNYLIYEYNNFIYGKSDFRFRTFILNAIYIPDDADVSTNEKFLNAVSSRLNNEFGNIATVSIGSISRLDSVLSEINDEFLAPYDISLDKNKIVNKVVNIKINNNSYQFIVIKDSSKIKSLNNDNNIITRDLATNSTIKFNSSYVPKDATIKITKNINNKNILEKLNIANGITFDINLFSNTLNDYVYTDDTNEFIVTVPISDDLKDKNLMAYYIGNNNKIETFSVEKQGNYVTFKTNHFSEYTIGEQQKLVGDMNNNGKLDLTDVIILLKRVLGL